MAADIPAGILYAFYVGRLLYPFFAFFADPVYLKLARDYVVAASP